MSTVLMQEAQLDRELRRLFGPQARSEGPLAASGAGRRLFGIDLRQRLGPEQVFLLVDALSQFRILCLPGQDLASFSLSVYSDSGYITDGSNFMSVIFIDILPL